MTSQGGRAAARAPGHSLRLGLIVALSAAAWAALAVWSASPYGRYLDHGGWGDPGLLAALCRSVPQGELVIPALLYASAWLLMIAAMMLPTTLPLLGIFSRITASRPDAGRLLLGADARHVRRRHGQPGLDARPCRRDGRREEPALGPTAPHSARAGPDRLGGRTRRRQSLTRPGWAERAFRPLRLRHLAAAGLVCQIARIASQRGAQCGPDEGCGLKA